MSNYKAESMETYSISGLQYTLGEHQRSFAEATGFDTVGIPNRPAMWGWGTFFETSKNVMDLLIATGRNTLEANGLALNEVDGVIVARGNTANGEEFGVAAMASLLRELGLKRAFGTTLTSNGCSSALAAIRTAGALVRNGGMKNVLILAGDKAGAAEQRFQRFGIFSDGACSCIVSAGSSRGFEVLASALATDISAMQADAAFSSGLASETNRQLFATDGLSSSKVSKVFSNNVFLPIVTLKELEAGFEMEQIYTANVARIGHCYAADPLINLADYVGGGHGAAGAQYVLAADSYGLRVSLLVKMM